MHQHPYEKHRVLYVISSNAARGNYNGRERIKGEAAMGGGEYTVPRKKGLKEELRRREGERKYVLARDIVLSIKLQGSVPRH